VPDLRQRILDVLRNSRDSWTAAELAVELGVPWLELDLELCRLGASGLIRRVHGEYQSA
jgi:hypothetical protein